MQCYIRVIQVYVCTLHVYDYKLKIKVYFQELMLVEREKYDVKPLVNLKTLSTYAVFCKFKLFVYLFLI